MALDLIFDGEIFAGQGTLRFRGVSGGEPVNFVVKALQNLSAGASIITGTVKGVGGSGGGGGSGEAIQFPIHQVGHGFLAGTPITETVTGWIKSENDVMTSAADAVVGEVVGPDDFVAQQFGILELSAAEWDALCSTTGGLPQGQYFWLDAASGKYTITRPSGLANFQQVAFKALSLTVAEILIPSSAVIPGAGGSGGGSGASNISIIPGVNTFTAGQLVQISGSGTYSLAKADTPANAEVVGIVSVAGNPFTITTGGYVTGLSGLVADRVYFLSPTIAGALTLVEPIVGGQISKPVFWADGATSGYFFNMRGQIIPSAGAAGQSSVIGAQWESSGAILITSAKPVDRFVAVNGIVKSVTVVTYGGVGSCTIGIKKNTFTSFPPTTNIVGSSPPVISSGVTYRDTTLSGWTTSVVANDVFRFSLDACSGFSRVAVTLEIMA